MVAPNGKDRGRPGWHGRAEAQSECQLEPLVRSMTACSARSLSVASEPSSADAALASIAACHSDEIGTLLGLARCRSTANRLALSARLAALGFETVGKRKQIEAALLRLGCPPPLQLPPARESPAPGAGPWIVCTHFDENTSWMSDLLHSHVGVQIIIYDCGVFPIPDQLAAHPRVELRDKVPPRPHPFAPHADNLVPTS